MQKRRATGLAALVVLGGVAGFLVASTALGSDFANIGSAVEAGTAYGLVSDDGVLRFEMVSSDAAIDPAAVFALYAPDDGFFGFYQLDREWSSEDVHIDTKGEWVVVIYELRESELAVSGDEDTLLDGARLVPLKTTERRVLVAESEGGAVRSADSAAVPTRPASIALDVTGSVLNLNAVVDSPEGRVLDVAGLSQNATDDAGTMSATSYTVHPEDLAAGTYRVKLTADDLAGRVELVFTQYVRNHLTTSGSVPEIDCAEEADEEADDDDDGDRAPIGNHGEDEAHDCFELVTADGLVHLQEHMPVAVVVPAGTSAIELLFDDVAMADLSVYGPSDGLVSYVHLGPEYDYRSHDPMSWQDSYSWRSTDETVVVPVTEPGEHVVYLRAFWGEAAALRVLDASELPAARVLELDVQEIGQQDLLGIEGSQKTISLERPLLDLLGGDWTWVELSHKLTVTGPAGPVLESARSVGAFGIALERSFAVHPESFVAGDYVIDYASQGVGSSFYLEFVTYQR